MASEEFLILADLMKDELAKVKDRLVWVLVVLALIAAELGIGLALP